jgi:hypothetical protein
MENTDDFEKWDKQQIELGCTECYKRNHLKIPYECGCKCHKKQAFQAGRASERAKFKTLLERVLSEIKKDLEKEGWIKLYGFLPNAEWKHFWDYRFKKLSASDKEVKE